MSVKNQISNLPFSGGWKYYNCIKKKAMEQEFSWTGLVLSLSIAFFVVIAAALTLNWLHHNLVFESTDLHHNIYHLEYLSDNYLHLDSLNFEKLEAIPLLA